MNTRKFLREVRGILIELNVPLIGVEPGKHFKFRIMTPRGPRTLSCSASASDQHALHMVRRNVKHLVEGRWG